ncbi:non-ribosomal peptide synthetase [Streptomyces sp. NPDC006798]|uniref:non-ribosomal peptide synthetase n=1 Tax=Streptomyces sp. NPDC006798 TaxID=3155462 RepID=UPI0033F6AED0
MVGMFRRRVARDPESIAVVAADGTLSYGELDARAAAVAGGLRDRGVGPDDIVAVAMPRGTDMVVAVVAVLAAGAAYLPVDTAQPPDRVAALLADARPALVLTPGELRALEASAGSAAPVADPDPACAAYVIYTSGSTGRPKGVVVPHTGIAQLVAAQRERFGAGPGARVLQYASVGFDVAVADLCMALLTGATLVLAPPDGLPPGEPFARFVAEHGVTHVCMPPSALAGQPDLALPSVACLIVAGEAPGPDLVARWSAGRRMINAYGPTETTACATMSAPLTGGPVVPIGAAIPGTELRVLDEKCAPAAEGELYIGGAGVARGYLGRPGPTAERFVADPWGPPGARMFRTGDLVRVLPDGDLLFLGRADDQVKIRGHRVEPAEVEAALGAHPAVARAAVVAHSGPLGAYLVGYVVPYGPSVPDLRAYLAERLPAHLVPDMIEVVGDFPLTPNGKLDRAAFAEPVPRASGALADDLARLFAEVLSVDSAAPDDDFFALGGTSLMATALVSRIRVELAVEVSVATVFDVSTPAELAEALSATDRTDPKDPTDRMGRMDPMDPVASVDSTRGRI